MIGAIVGDIVGSRFEFDNIKSKDFAFFHPACRPTDDSVMTLAVGEALLEHRERGGDLADAAIRQMKAWGLRYPDAGYGGMFVDWLEEENPKPYRSWGNGAAMRVTHDHPEGLAGAERVRF